MTEALSALKPYIARIFTGETLSQIESEQAFGLIMDGQATPAQMAAFVTALRMRKESVDEICGAVSAIRAKALPITAPAGAMDIVGTGGDGTHTLNISTATAIVTAACGVDVAKHGNRAVSSRSGMSDVLTALGINLNADFSILEDSLRQSHLCFMQAPRHHASFRHVAPVRAELGIRTIFNILGPLCNPAGVKRYLLGVYAQEWVRPIADTLLRLGCENAWVVFGAGGLDELSTLGSNYVCKVSNGTVEECEVHPRDAGLPLAALADIQGGDSTYNAGRIRELLAGQKDAYRDIVLFGAAAAQLIAGTVQELKEGVAVAEAAIDTGKASAVLDNLVQITNN